MAYGLGALGLGLADTVLGGGHPLSNVAARWQALTRAGAPGTASLGDPLAPPFGGLPLGLPHLAANATLTTDAAGGTGGPQSAPNPDPVGPNPGNFFKFEVFGVDAVTPLGGFEFSSAFFVGRDRAGNFQAGAFVEGGFAIGAGLSVDTLGVEFVGNIDQLDRSLSINLVVGAGPFNAQGNLNPTPPNPADGTRFFGEFANGVGLGLSFGPLPVESFGSFTRTRAFDVIGFGRRFFGQ